MPTPPHHVLLDEDLAGIEGVAALRVVDADGRDVPGPRVVIVGRMHGNEPVGEHVLERLRAQGPRHLVRGTVVLVLANLAARAEGRRHTAGGTDMNRLWDADRLAALAAADPAHLCAEERRVRELAPVVLGGDVVLDLHSTSRPSPPHLLFRDDLAHVRIARRLGVQRLVTGIHENGVLDGAVCSNAGLRPGERSARLGFTLEAGEHDNPENVERAREVVVRLLACLGVWDEPLPDSDVVPEVYEILDRFRQAPAGTPPYRFVGYEGGEPGGGRRAPPRRLESFEHVEADEIVLRRAGGEVVRAEAPFVLLMPAPKAGPGEDLFFVAQRRPDAPGERADTDEAARAEARAVERMLDVLAWDEAERGTTRVTITSRRTLDLCADLVGRACRLPPEHPHRRITVVGRGEAGGDEAEARAALRWRTALETAHAEGVPVERVQLLRGASVAFLRRLIDGLMDAPSVRLSFSPTHPHTVSAVVAGDVERALATGELRHVAVGLVIEATSVEPDGDEVRTLVARAGLFGARPELLTVVAGLLRDLRAEHALAVRSGLFGDLAQVLPDGDAALGPLDAATAARVRDAVVEVQLRRWRALLRRVVTRPLVLERGTLGAWLARVVSATGIYDVDLLRRWLVRPVEGGWAVDPEALDGPAPVLDVPPAHRRLPRPVLRAAEVDRDDVDRFLGWKRFVGEAQALSGDHGRDLDLLFAPERVQERAADWLEDVLEEGARAPGTWRVVVAGDGHAPGRETGAAGERLLRAHRALVLRPDVHYTRIQHVHGSHLPWLRDLVDLAGRRPPGPAPLALCWEAEHGGAVHVLLVARASTPPSDPWSLEDWEIVRALVLVGGRGPDGGYRVALATRGDDVRPPNAELVHFGRVHCDRLLRQAAWRFVGQGGPAARVSLEAAVRQLLTERVAGVAAQLDLVRALGERERRTWAAHRLGLHDEAFADALVEATLAGSPPGEVAQRLWAEVGAWPGGPA